MEIRGGKRYRTKSERRRIVEETLKPGVTVTQVARAHGISPNQVFEWRRHYREGGLGEAEAGQAGLLPVRVLKAPAATGPALRSKLASASIEGSIDIDLGHVRVRIAGTAERDCVRAALEGLVG